VFPTSISLAILYFDFNNQGKPFIVILLLIIILVGMATLIYTIIKIPVWVLRDIK